MREAAISVASILITAVIGIAGWGASDRLHWAAKEQQIDDTADTVNGISQKMDQLPKNFVTRQEYEQIFRMIQNDHTDTMNALDRLSDRVDNLARMDNLPPGALGSRSGGYPTAQKGKQGIHDAP